MDFPEKVFTAFSDSLVALYSATDRDRRASAVLTSLRPVFEACDITIDPALSSGADDVGVNPAGDIGILAVPIDGTSQQLTLQRAAGFTGHERFLAQHLRAHLAAAFGGRRPAPAPPPPPNGPADLRGLGLTPRECEVLHWIIHGKRDAEIAAILGTAPRTVNKHVENLLAKLGAESRLAAARVAADWLARSSRTKA